MSGSAYIPAAEMSHRVVTGRIHMQDSTSSLHMDYLSVDATAKPRLALLLQALHLRPDLQSPGAAGYVSAVQALAAAL